MMLTFEQFCDHLSKTLVLSAPPIHRETKLVEDLQFDSLSMLELVAVLDQLDAVVPDCLMTSLTTAGDAYDLYRNHVVVKAQGSAS